MVLAAALIAGMAVITLHVGAIGEPSAPPSPAGACRPSRPTWSSSFEDGSFSAYRASAIEGYGFDATRSVTTEHARTGRRSAKLVMPPATGGDAVGRDLSEYGGPFMHEDEQWWFAISMYIGDDWDLSQLTGGRGYFANILSFRWQQDSNHLNGPGSGINAVIRNGTPIFESAVITGSGDARGARGVLNLGPVVKGQWIDWVIHVKWSMGSDGFRYFYRDGKLVGEDHGPNMYEDLPITHRIGLYEGTQVDHTRTLYWDDHRMGKSYAQVCFP